MCVCKYGEGKQEERERKKNIENNVENGKEMMETNLTALSRVNPSMLDQCVRAHLRSQRFRRV